MVKSLLSMRYYSSIATMICWIKLWLFPTTLHKSYRYLVWVSHITVMMAVAVLAGVVSGTGWFGSMKRV